jgi:hypothetical protein
MLHFIILINILLTNLSFAMHPGDKYSYTLDDKNNILNMRYVPGKISFPIWKDDSRIATVFDSYLIGETELTYGIWKLVYNWAIKNGYK